MFFWLDDLFDPNRKPQGGKKPARATTITSSIAASSGTKAEPKVGTKPESKPVAKPEMLQWPDNPRQLVSYDDIVKPIRAILNKGYRLTRKADVQEFDYDGLEIGAFELQHHTSNRFRFTKAHLEHEDKHGQNKLIDVLIHVAVLLGIEQGRRAERQRQVPMEQLNETLVRYREANRDLRYQLDVAQARLEIRNTKPFASERQIQQLIAQKVRSGRDRRVSLVRQDLAHDPVRTAYQPSHNSRSSFFAMVAMAKHLKCTHEDWASILKKHGWDVREFWATAHKKNVRLMFG